MLDKERGYVSRYFLLSFAIAFLALSVLFLFLMTLAHPKTPKSLLEDRDLSAASPVYLPQAEDAITVLFMGSPTREDAPHTYLLVRFDPARGTVPVTVLPGETAIQNNGKIESLNEVYLYGGMDYTKETLAQNLGVPIDRYVRMSGNDLKKAAAAIGSVEFDLPYAVELVEGGVAMLLQEGIQLLDGGRVTALMGYRGYAEGEEARRLLVGDLTVQIINQRMDVVLSTVIDQVFETIINTIDTDITHPDYELRKPAGAFLAELGQDPAVNLVPTGSWNEEESLYTLSDTFLALVAQTYG